ncbi:MAG TPA: peptidoglycan DD-metalloendopeptidase family protein [Candidatus Polarisedimenticolia bacterium]|nr:peptidoglycan DD-metalloendopeptidase family protein [Candidatus Polarisedimenticolia bacterium]
MKVGQRVRRGDVIATTGTTGRSTGPHLHYEVLVHQKTVDPLLYILEESKVF